MSLDMRCVGGNLSMSSLAPDFSNLEPVVCLALGYWLLVTGCWLLWSVRSVLVCSFSDRLPE